MKTSLHIQYLGKDILDAELTNRVKDAWKEQGNKIKDIKELNLYVKIEENSVYYTINGSHEGKLDI